MPALNGQKRYLTFKGVGKGFMNDLAGNRIFDVVKATSVKLEWEVKLKDLVGGDSVFPFGAMVTDATGSVTITEGTLDMNVMQAQTNTPVQYGVSATVWAIDEQTTIAAATTYNLVNKLTLVGDPIIRFLDGSGQLTKTAITPTAGQFENTAGVITFCDADAGKAVTIDYQYTVATADVASATSKPGILYGTYIHTVKYMNPITAVEGLGQLVIYRCAYSGKNSLDFKRSDAVTPGIVLNVYDPSRPDGRVFDLIKIS